jgi:putative FmdB family regulatory protein
MPIYEYECGKCGVFEQSQRMSDPALTKCPTCRRKVRRLISNTSFQLKGTGWYVTDYARAGKDGKQKGGSDGGDSASSDSSSASSSSESKSESTKSDAKKSESKSESKKTDSKPSTGSTPASAAS